MRGFLTRTAVGVVLAMVVGGCLSAKDGGTAEPIGQDPGTTVADATPDIPQPSDASDPADDKHAADGTFCAPGDRKCGPDNAVYECAADGSRYELAESCDSAAGFACVAGECLLLCTEGPHVGTSRGCDFWFADLDNATIADPYGAQHIEAFGLVVANPSDSPLPATLELFWKEPGLDPAVVYDANGEPMTTAPLAPGEVRLYQMPRRDVNGTVLAPLAFRLRSDVPVIAQQFNPLEPDALFSADASLLLPNDTLGQEYLVMTREQSFELLRSYVTVIAVTDGTQVSVATTAPTQPGVSAPWTPHEQPLPHMEPGDVLEVELDQYDTLNLETDRPGADPTGTRVTASQPVVVFGGSEAANAPNTDRCLDGVCVSNPAIPCDSAPDCAQAGLTTCCADHLEEQLPPIASWGARYLATKAVERGEEPDIWRVLAAEDDTLVELRPAQPGVTVQPLDAGEWFELEAHGHFELRSQGNKPVLLAQFLTSQDAAGLPPSEVLGDPAMMLAVPVDRYRDHCEVVVLQEFDQNYLNITTTSGAEVQLDGASLDPGNAELVGVSGYVVYRLEVSPGLHAVTGDKPLSVMVYGYSNHASYGYPGCY